MTRLGKLIRSMPPEAQRKVEDYAQSLVVGPSAGGHEASRKLSLGWAGSLSHLHDRFTSVELQHDALRQWGRAGLEGGSEDRPKP